MEFNRNIAALVITGVIALVAGWQVMPLIFGGGETETREARDVSPEEAARRARAKELRAAARLATDRVTNPNSEPDIGNWMLHGRTYDEQRFSPLTQINRDNVGTLGVAWEFRTNTVRGLESSPIVVDGIMFASGNWGVVWALDAKTGELLWTYDPEVPGEWARNACCDIVNRGVAVWKGGVFVATLDGRLVKLDADTGKPIWDINTIDRNRSYTITMAPRIIKDMVIVGNGGGEFGVRGYFTAYDTKTGRQLWRFYTVPGNPELPLENPELAAALPTWSDQGGSFKWWELGGGGTVWDSMAYDPELDLLYVGTGNGSPWSRFMRSPGGGDNLYVSSILAIRPETGELVWHYQTTPGDTWDYTATQHIVLADLNINGTVRKVLMQAPKNGFFYVIDRETGKLISADNYIAVTWAKGIDFSTGRPIENPEALYNENMAVVVPAPAGGHNWQPMAWNPNDGLMYIPVMEQSAGIYSRERPEAYVPGIWNTGNDFSAIVEFIQNVIASGQTLPPVLGFIRAWDPVTQTERWSVPMTGSWNSGMMTTASGLLFAGGGDGIFAAYNSTSGEQLWKIDLTTGILAPSVTYTVDGEQYVAVVAGWGGVGLTNLRDPNMAAIKYGTNQGRIFAFKLGGRQSVEPIAAEARGMEAPPEGVPDPGMVDQGFRLYNRNCLVCHGFFAESTGVIPDLRMSDRGVWDSWDAIVLEGALSANGMASFADVLKPEDVADIRAYVLAQAQKLWAATSGPAPAPAPEPAPETPQ
ncbi:MAG TPA: PQQ-dependent dehydrogenase, methanol/ethanol family [Micropepsaceae bacterium]|nr:PQQ-dependent dehydrogenase, methanol/ethanol family [Micropepsaceae bacterium]